MALRRRRERSGSKLKLYLAIMLGTAVLILYVSAHVFILSLENSIRDLQERRVQLTGEVTSLEIEVARLKNTTRIKKIAREELGLIMPEGAPKKLF